MEPVDGWWLGACRVPTATSLWNLAQRAGGWSELEHSSRTELIELGVAPEDAARWVSTPDGRTRGTAIVRSDPRYPRSLARCELAPAVLFVEGDPGCLARPGVAIVGTRRCSARGATLARQLGADLARAGTVVVSGLARGIDTAAHRGALVGRTVAVLGHGLAHQAPRSNATLRKEIIEGGGAVLAGWPDEVPPDRWTFPARNRWVAALSHAVVVVEGPRSSGALITARDALHLGIDVWVVPGPPSDPLSQGPLALLETQITEDSEAFEALRSRVRGLLERLGEPVPDAVRSGLGHLTGGSDRGRVRLLAEPSAFVHRMTGADVAQREAWLVHLLEGASVDEVARTWRIPPVDLQAELTRRELGGELVRLPGGRYAAAS